MMPEEFCIFQTWNRNQLGEFQVGFCFYFILPLRAGSGKSEDLILSSAWRKWRILYFCSTLGPFFVVLFVFSEVLMIWVGFFYLTEEFFHLHWTRKATRSCRSMEKFLHSLYSSFIPIILLVKIFPPLEKSPALLKMLQIRVKITLFLWKKRI